jgi:sterol desaturase/sphingolipid hydroxylase (fatty acid hydroxylase superfamily)
MTLFEFNIIKNYMLLNEMAGHKGTRSFPTPAFQQFIWLPRFLRIGLYAEDHDMHHSHNNCNYSKRFSLWDKAFGTYIPAENSVKEQ